MKVAIVGSRSIRINILSLINYLNNNVTSFDKFIPDNREITELVSGGCLNSPDQDVKEFCERKDYKYSYKEFLPNEKNSPYSNFSIVSLFGINSTLSKFGSFQATSLPYKALVIK